MKEKEFSIRDRLKSFIYAFNGIRLLIRTEHNARIHLTAAGVATALGFYFRIQTYEWIAVILCIGSVIAAETFNSALEYLADFVSPEYSSQIGAVKDLSAAAVLFTAITAGCAGAVIFIPKIHALI